MLGKNSKRRAPIKQLREAAIQASDMLSKRGLQHNINILELIAQDSNAPILPGVPSYLPHKWTIEASRKAMFALLREWADRNKEDEDVRESATEFFSFVVKNMQEYERKYSKEKRETESSIKRLKKAPLLYEIFSPVRKHQTTRGLHKFFVDSFAVFVIVKNNGNTTDYAEWFLGEWTPSLDNLWNKKDVKAPNPPIDESK